MFYNTNQNMKAILASILLFIATAMPSFGTDQTNGTFYIDKPVECHLIANNGSATTNKLTAGKTYMVSDVLLEMVSTEKTTFYFSGGLMVEASSDSVMSINLFDQEVNNLESQPRKAEFGTHNISLTFNKGEFCVVYPNTNAYSSLIINTPYSAYEVNNGKFFFRSSEKSVVAYVLEGMMQVHGDKKNADKTEKGKLAMAIPFTDPASGVEDKIVTSIKTLKQEETDRFASPVLVAERKYGNVQFFVINGRVIGVWVK